MNVKGKLLTLENGVVVVPFEARKYGHWGAVIVDSGGDDLYAVGQYNLIIDRDQIASAVEAGRVKSLHG